MGEGGGSERVIKGVTCCPPVNMNTFPHFTTGSNASNRKERAEERKGGKEG